MAQSSQTKRFSDVMRFTLLIFPLIAAMFVSRVHASSTQVVYNLGGGDGSYFDTELVMDKSGNLYGTSVAGGDFSSGNVFQLTPAGKGWNLTVLYSFTSGRDGAQPYKGVTLDSHGDLYGTTKAVGESAKQLAGFGNSGRHRLIYRAPQRPGRCHTRPPRGWP